MSAGTWMVIAFVAFVVAVIIIAVLRTAAREDRWDEENNVPNLFGLPVVTSTLVEPNQVTILTPDAFKALGNTAARTMGSLVLLQRTKVSQQTFPGVDEVSFDFPAFVPYSRPYDWNVDNDA